MDKYIHDEKNGLWYERLLLFLYQYQQYQCLARMKYHSARRSQHSGDKNQPKDF